MNKFLKIITSALTAAVMLSGSAVLTGAASLPKAQSNCGNPQVYVISNCQNSAACKNAGAFLKAGCSQLQQLWEQYCCNKNSCPSTQSPTQPAQPVTQPAKPAEQPTEDPKPTEQATQPAQPTQPPASSAYNQAYEDEVIRLVNAERAKYGLAALSKHAGATTAAEIRAKEIVQSFSHTRPNGTSCFTVCKELGISYRSAGENIAYGQRTPQQVVNGWMNSEGHRKNILSASFTSIGVGCYQQGNTLYWSQMFIG